MQRYLLLLLLAVFSLNTFAQVAVETRYLDRYAHPQKSPLSFQAKIGFTALETPASSLADLEHQNYFLNPALSLGLGYQWTNYIGFQLRGSYYRHSQESSRIVQNFKGIKSNNFEGVLALKHYIFPISQFDQYLRRFNFYGLLGGGLLYLNPRVEDTGERLAETMDIDQFTWVVPVGAGIELRMTNFFMMGVEANYHFTGAEFLDGVANEAIKSSRSQDNFVSLGVNVTFRLPYSEYKYDELLKLKDKPPLQD